VYSILYASIRLITGVDIPRSVSVGPGLRIWHFGGIVINGDTRIGKNCTMKHGVTIGSIRDEGPSPTIGDDVQIGAHACVLGPIVIGNSARIGAASLVLSDVPADATAVGVPARIIPAKHDAAAA
jgi:serine O-acetyltransferase